MNSIRVEREIGGKVLSLESGKLAKQAHGSVLVRYADTIVLCAADGRSFALREDSRRPF